MSDRAKEDGLLLPGLDGTNPLGFLAALGVLRVLSFHQEDVKLSWKMSAGAWRPVVLRAPRSLSQLGTDLHEKIRRLDQSAWFIDKELPFRANKLREHAQNTVDNSCWSSRVTLDTLSAFGAECFREQKIVKKEVVEIFEDTAFRLVRSGDNQHKGLLEYAAFTLADCGPEQIQRCLTSDWHYRDEKKSFRWDPAEDRGYAYQWGDPGDDGALTERGANCLALFGMTLFPVIPSRRAAETTGFGLKEAKKSSFTWPIWNYPLNVSVVASMLALDELQRPYPDRLKLMSMGFAAVYRSDRVMTSTYYWNFTPAWQVC